MSTFGIRHAVDDYFRSQFWGMFRIACSPLVLLPVPLRQNATRLDLTPLSPKPQTLTPLTPKPQTLNPKPPEHPRAWCGRALLLLSLAPAEALLRGAQMARTPVGMYAGLCEVCVCYVCLSA